MRLIDVSLFGFNCRTCVKSIAEGESNMYEFVVDSWTLEQWEKGKNEFGEKFDGNTEIIVFC